MLLPLYHTVSNDNLNYTKNLYPIRNVQQFIKDIDFILKYFVPVDIDTVIKFVNNQGGIKSNSVLFTFDDGLKEVYEIIAPILKQKGVPAVFFVNTGFIDNKDLFYRYKASLLIEEIQSKGVSRSEINEIASKWGDNPGSDSELKENILNITYGNKSVLDEIAKVINLDFKEFLINNQPYLTSEQIRSLINEGFTIGSHSVGHPEYYKITFEGQIKQTQESIRWLNDNFKQKYSLFAFPFTDYGVSKQFFETIYSSEKPVIDLSFGCAGLKDEIYSKHLQRIPMEIQGQSAGKIIKMEYLKYLAKRSIGKNMIKRH